MLLTQHLFLAPLRGFRSKPLSYSRFTRESLRNRLHRQDLKQPIKEHGSQVPYAADIIPVRPVSHLLKALGFTVAVGAGAFTVSIISDYERQSQSLKTLFEKARFSNFSFSANDWRNLSDGDKCALYLVGVMVPVFSQPFGFCFMEGEKVAAFHVAVLQQQFLF
ncbi:hypothetical protein NECAME_00854 [Necator americanus]|uniref:Uncharacterized protein n=1 Tax=Necator americanus TaxID=51031 RepID=W2SNC7_NECAM|nr:hypothetical protein NECAME_00854 [Necator americanus]ETN71165.1 hypothetical protein NECAME_00854 [Necator americanus]